MRIEDYAFEPISILDRLCEVYGFHQKVQLANHFNMSASSLSNRYTRGNVSYDLAAICALETGTNIRWILTGEGQRNSNQPDALETPNGSIINIQSFTISESHLKEGPLLSIGDNFFTQKPTDSIAVRADGKLHFIEKLTNLSDGHWLVDIEGAISIRELTVLPAKKLHVAGGKVPFECTVGDIATLGRVVGTYSETN